MKYRQYEIDIWGGGRGRDADKETKKATDEGSKVKADREMREVSESAGRELK